MIRGMVNLVISDKEHSMSDAPLEWDGKPADALRLLRVSHKSDVTCEIVTQAIIDRLKTAAEIKEESQSISEKPVPRANELSRLNIEISDLRKLASIKGCPTVSIGSDFLPEH